MEFIGKYKNWYQRLVAAGYESAESKIKSFMESHNDIVWEQKLIDLIKKGMDTKLAMEKISYLREAFSGDGKCEMFVQSIESEGKKNKTTDSVNIKSLPIEERMFFLKKIKTKYFEENFDDLYQELESECVKRGYVDNEIKFIIEGKHVKAYVLVDLIM